MNLKQFIISSIVAFVVALTTANATTNATADAQDSSTIYSDDGIRVGITGGFALNRQTANFLEFEGVKLFDFRTGGGVYPPNFREGVGNGFYAGVLTKIPLVDAFSLTLRGTFAQHNSTLSVRELYPTKTDTTSFSDHTLQTSLPSIGVEALAMWNVLQTGLQLQAGLRGAYMPSAQFTYTERTGKTLSGGLSGFTPTFEPVRTLPDYPANSIIPQFAAIQVHALAGIGYEFAVGERLRIMPEILYAFALTNALNSPSAQVNTPNAWALHQFRGGVAVTLPLPKPPAAPLPPPQDTAKPVPMLAVQAFGLPALEQTVGDTSRINEEQASVILRVQQTISRSVFPLLPYIFFDGIGATALSERYSTLTREETKTFRESKLSSAYELTPKEHSYYNVLNVVGERLRRLPKAVLSIHGCTDGFTAERDKADVAKARAQAVMRYLRDVWQIPAAQLKLVDNTIAPTTPSIPLSDADKQAENRRVELRSDTPEILANITLIDTVRRVSPPSVRFRLSAANIDSVRSWKIVVRQSGTIVKELRGTGALAEVQDWRMDERELAALHLDESVQQGQAVEPLEYTFSCIDADGNLYRSATAAIPLETRTEEKNSKRTRTSSYFAGKLVERFNLILFDFAKSTMTSEQEPMMNLMRTRITERSTVRVDGFTDRTGEAEFNRKLSLQRALGVAQALGFTAEQQKTNVMGYGSSLELYNNDLPEGRFYSRTVRVIVETPQND